MSASKSGSPLGKPSIISFEGELSIANKEETERRLNAVIDAQDLILDLSQVSYVDSVSLSIVAKSARLREHRSLAAPKLVVTSPNLKRIFSITALDKTFTIFETLDKAIRSYK